MPRDADYCCAVDYADATRFRPSLIVSVTSLPPSCYRHHAHPLSAFEAIILLSSCHAFMRLRDAACAAYEAMPPPQTPRPCYSSSHALDATATLFCSDSAREWQVCEERRCYFRHRYDKRSYRRARHDARLCRHALDFIVRRSVTSMLIPRGAFSTLSRRWYTPRHMQRHDALSCF